MSRLQFALVVLAVVVATVVFFPAKCGATEGEKLKAGPNAS